MTVRFFPRATRHRLATTAVVALTAGALAVPVISPSLVAGAFANDHSDRLKKKRADVKKQIKGVGADLEESSNELVAATTRLANATTAVASAQAKLVAARAKAATAEAALVKAQAEDAAMKAALAAARIELANATAALTVGQASAAAQRVKVESTMIRTAQGGDPRLLALAALLNASSPADIARQSEFTDLVVSSQAATYDDLRASEILLQVREHEVKAAKQQVAVQARAAAEHLAVVADLERQAVAARDAVAASLTQAVAARADAKDARAQAEQQKVHDLRLLRQLKQEEERIRQRILAAAKSDRNRNVDNLNGLFAVPVANSWVTSPYGWRKHPIYGYWGLHDGDDFHAPCGVPLLATDGGKVTDAYYSDVWGNRLFLDLGNVNGHNYTAIYNHISAYKVSVGAFVARGQTIALAGTTGWSTACHLHFTILKDGTAIDPQTVL